jgi:hypothetical protein
MLQTQSIALTLSIAIETPLAMFLVRNQQLSQWAMLLVAVVAAAATLFTHPIVWALNQLLANFWSFPIRAVIVETLAILVEGVIYWQVLGWMWSRSFQISLITNLASFSLGLLLFSLGDR